MRKQQWPGPPHQLFCRRSFFLLCAGKFLFFIVGRHATVSPFSLCSLPYIFFWGGRGRWKGKRKRGNDIIRIFFRNGSFLRSSNTLFSIAGKLTKKVIESEIVASAHFPQKTPVLKNLQFAHQKIISSKVDPILSPTKPTYPQCANVDTFFSRHSV